MGIEPTQLAWEARTLPLSYTRKTELFDNLVNYTFFMLFSQIII